MATATRNEINIDFLGAELDMGCSMLRIAQSETSTGRVECQSVLAAARAALGTIRRLEGGIEDIHAWRDIHDRANALKSALAAVCLNCSLRARCDGEENDVDARAMFRDLVR